MGEDGRDTTDVTIRDGSHTFCMAKSRAPRPRCRAATTKDKPCKREVSSVGQRCKEHHGKSEWVPKRDRPRIPKPRSPQASEPRATRRRRPTVVSTRVEGAPRQRKRTSAERKRIERFSNVCLEMARQGVLDAVPERATAYVGEVVWRMVSRRWRRRNCTALALLARKILEGKAKVHRGVGRLFAYLIALAGGDLIARVFAEKLGERLPLPFVDQKCTVVARGLQLTGMFFCVVQDRRMGQCACFIDVFDTEGPALLQQLMLCAGHDWAQLHHLQLTASNPT